MKAADQPRITSSLQIESGATRKRRSANARFSILAFAALLLGLSDAQASNVMPGTPPHLLESGTPAFVVLSPEAMGLSATPTDLHLMPDGRILVAAPREVTFSDGVRWDAFRGAEGEPSIPGHVIVDDDGGIYAGVPNGVARLELGADSRWQMRKIVSLPADEGFRTATLRSVREVNGTWYWFGTGVVRWRPGETVRGVVNTPPIEAIFPIGSRTFAAEVSTGMVLEMLPDGNFQRISTEHALRSQDVTCAVPFAPGVALLGTISEGLKLFDGTILRPFGSVGKGNRITHLCVVSDYFAAALDGRGIVFFDREGRTVQVLDRSLDYRLGRPRKIAATSEGVIWVLLNEGVARLEFPSPISHFEPLLASGLSHISPLRHEGKLWLLSDGRAMRGVYREDGLLDRFEEDTPPGNYVFTLDSVHGHLLAANETGVYMRHESGWQLIAAGIVNGRFPKVQADARGWLYVARGEFGFIKPSAEGFTTHRIPVQGMADIYNAVVDRNGVVALELGTRAARLDPRPETPTLQILGPDQGLGQGWVEIYELEGVTRFDLPDRILRFDDATNMLVEDRELLARFPQLRNASGRPILDPFGRLWYTNDVVRLLERDAVTGAYVEKKLPVAFGALSFSVQEDGVMWLSDNRRFARLDLRVVPLPARPLTAQITSVQLSASNRRIFKPGRELPALAYEDNSVVVHFAAPSNPFAAPVTFEVLLEGAGTQWVSTGSVGSAAFTRLKEGDYTFRVRPISGEGRPGTEAQLRFAVRPPWYRTPLAWTLYALGGTGVIALTIWLPVLLQRRENARLEQLVASRTQELHAINRQLGQQIKETTEKSAALSASEERYRMLNADLEHRVDERTAQLSHSNEELRQRESLFRLIFEHAPVGIAWKRTDLGNAYHFNPTFSRILELHTDKAEDYALLAALVHPEDSPRQKDMDRRIGTGELDSYNIEQRFTLRSGRLVWGSLSVAVVRDRDGRIVQDIAILEDITARKQAEHELANTYKELVAASRMAGMAEVATGVLHNVGNVLNSLNVSSTVIGTKARTAQADKLVKLAALLNEHAHDLGHFLTEDPKGRLLPDYVAMLAKRALEERDWLVAEVASMQKNIDHIKEIVTMQQGYARVAGVTEIIEAETLFEDALQINSTALASHSVNVVREFLPVPMLCVEKGKILQILINLIRNAMFACDESRSDFPGGKHIVVRVEPGASGETVKLIVRDNGIGIPPENMLRIFRHGFTTRANGHGFGLHASALAAKEMKGSLTAHSDGPGTGATFTLELPVAPAGSAPGNKGTGDTQGLAARPRRVTAGAAA